MLTKKFSRTTKKNQTKKAKAKVRAKRKKNGDIAEDEDHVSKLMKGNDCTFLLHLFFWA